MALTETGAALEPGSPRSMPWSGFGFGFGSGFGLGFGLRVWLGLGLADRGEQQHLHQQHHACHDNSVGVTTVCGIRIRLHMKSVAGIAMDSLASPCRSGSADARVYTPRYAGRALVARLTERAEEAEEAAPHAWLPAGALPARAVPSVRGGRAEEDGAHDSCFLPGHAR